MNRTMLRPQDIMIGDWLMPERAKTITQTAMREKISPIVSQMTALIAEAFQVGFDAGMECGKYTNYQQED